MTKAIISEDEVKNELAKYGFALLGKYINTYTHMVISDKLGYKYFITWNSFRFKSKKIFDISSSLNCFSQENLLLFIKNNNLNIKIIENEGYRLKDFIIIEDCETKFKYKIKIKYFLSKAFLKRNFIDNEYTFYNIKIFINKYYPEMKVINRKYNGIFSKIFLIDKNGYKYSVSLDNLIRHNVHQGIVSIGNIYSIKNINKYIKLNGIRVKLLSKDYTNQQDKLKFLCLSCKTKYECSWANFSRDRRCMVCRLKNHESNIGTNVKEYLKNKYNAIPEYKIFKSPKTNRWLPFDVYIPKYNIFIEINGLQHYYFIKYWHGKKYTFEDQIYRDNLKKEYATKNGIFIEIDLRKEKTKEIVINKIEETIIKYDNKII
jgi:hypothetical protein